MSFIAGPYTATWDGDALGITEDGFSWSPVPFHEKIRGDNMGDTTQDTVYRGLGMTIEFTLEEYDKAGVEDLLWPYHATLGNHGQAGVLGSALAKALVLTAVAGTTAATVPASMTFPYTIIDPDFASQIRLRAGLRKVPIRLIAFPNANSVFFTQT